MSEPAFRYAVLRRGPGLPEEFMPPDLDGRWFDIERMPVEFSWLAPDSQGEAVAVATDRFERRDSDGATARVYELQV